MSSNDLLLLYDTFYGSVAESPPWVAYPGSSSLGKMSSQEEWREGLFGTTLPAEAISGVISDNTPIDFIHWELCGNSCESGLEWWHKCISPLTRL